MYALISVSDKKGIVEFAKAIRKAGYSIISTGGTYEVLKKNHVKVTPIHEITEFPEMLDGRVKTLHPKIHGGLLALRDNDDHMMMCAKFDIPLINIVVVNLYPFEKAVEKKRVNLETAIENIDIGGPSMIRSAAKNFESVAVVTNPDRYPQIMEELNKHNGSIPLKTRQKLALEAFQHTSRYDTIIANFLDKRFNTAKQTEFPEVMTPIFQKIQDLRYGENPHQQAAYYRGANEKGLHSAEQLNGKDLSFNNYIDLNAAWSIAKEFDLPAVSIIKHTNPCGVAVGDNIQEAYKKAFKSDPVSAFGSIISLNRNVYLDVAREIIKTFVEAIIAPSYDDDALKLLSQKQNMRVMKMSDFFQEEPILHYKNVKGGFLVQTSNTSLLTRDQLKCVTEKKPPAKLINDLLFAFLIVKHIKSNAILVVKNGQTIGIGAGQMSRIDAVKIALEKAGDKAQGAVVASDAFFPFKDSIEQMAQYGIIAIVQPGGSIRDQESIDAANKHKIAMVFTDIRYFRH